MAKDGDSWDDSEFVRGLSEGKKPDKYNIKGRLIRGDPEFSERVESEGRVPIRNVHGNIIGIGPAPARDAHGNVIGDGWNNLEDIRRLYKRPPEGKPDLTGMEISSIKLPDIMGPKIDWSVRIGDFGQLKGLGDSEKPIADTEKPADDSGKQLLGTPFVSPGSLGEPREEPAETEGFRRLYDIFAGIKGDAKGPEHKENLTPEAKLEALRSGQTPSTADFRTGDVLPPIKLGPHENMIYDILKPDAEGCEAALQKRIRREGELNRNLIRYPKGPEFAESLEIISSRTYTPRKPSLESLFSDRLDYYLKANNRKHGERQVDLAVKGWVLSTNTDNNPRSIRRGIEFAKWGGDLEIHIESTAYQGFATQSPLGKEYVAIYSKGGRYSRHKVPQELTQEARSYHRKLGKSKEKALRFLLGVYKQVVVQERDNEGRAYKLRGMANKLVRSFKFKEAMDLEEEAGKVLSKPLKGDYAQRFQARQGEIAAVLHYFADKLRGFGRTTEATRLDAVVDKYIAKPVDPLKNLFTHSSPFEDASPEYLGIRINHKF